MADIDKKKFAEQPAVAKQDDQADVKKTPESQAKSGTVEVRKDEAGNVSLHNPECDKMDVLYPSTDHIKK